MTSSARRTIEIVQECQLYSSPSRSGSGLTTLGLGLVLQVEDLHLYFFQVNHSGRVGFVPIGCAAVFNADKVTTLDPGGGDLHLLCLQCGVGFQFSRHDQGVYASFGRFAPQICPSCALEVDAPSPPALPQIPTEHMPTPSIKAGAPSSDPVDKALNHWFVRLVLIAAIVGAIFYTCVYYPIIREADDPGPDEGDICTEVGEVYYDEDGNRLVCR